MKKIQKYIILCAVFVTPFLFSQDASSAENEDAAALSKEIADLWGERACVGEATHKYEERVLSIACNAEYRSVERDRMLDYLFRKGYYFRAESYNVKGTTGHYWYKFIKKDGYRTNTLYVRLHIASQGAPWGTVKPPAQIALYVDYLKSADELTAWQTLGVPVAFGLKASEEAKDLFQQLEEYKQEAWLSLDLKQTAFAEPGQTASIRDIIDQDLIAPYVKNAFEMAGDVWGVVIRDLNSISATVASARAVFSAVKAENKTYTLLPAKENRALQTTANVMGMNNHKVTYDMTAMCKSNPSKIWAFLKKNVAQGRAIVRFPASDKRCALRLSRTLRRDGKIEFKPLSSFFGYVPGKIEEGRGD